MGEERFDEDFETEEDFERALAGELEEPEEHEESDEQEHEPEEQQDTDEQEHENLVPQSRVDEITRARKEAEEKLSLLRTDPEEYYRQYPDERPPEKPQEKDYEKALPNDPSKLVVEGGMYHGFDLTPYHGLTLGELYQQNPALAAAVQQNYLRDIELEQQKEVEQKRRYAEESEREITAFMGRLAGEMFQKDASALSAEESEKIDGIIGQTIEWGTKTGRGAGILEDMYYLMNRENDLKKAKAQGAKSLVDSVTRTGARTVSSGGDGGEATGFERYESMTADQLADALDTMDDSEVAKFFREAPASLKRKHPTIPWE